MTKKTAPDPTKMNPPAPAAVEALLADPKGAEGSPPEVAAAAIERAIERRLPGPLWILAGHASRPIAKSARRALFLLRVQGVDVGERTRDARPAGQPAPPEAEEPCWSSMDGSGLRILLIAVKLPVGYELGLFSLSDEAGVMQGGRAEASRRQLRARLEQLAAGLAAGDSELVELPRPRALALLAAAAEIGGVPEPLATAREMLARLGPADPALAAPPSASAPPLPAEEEAESLSASGELLDGPLGRTMALPDALLKDLAFRIQEVQASQVLLDDGQRRRQIGHLLDRAIEGFFTPALRRIFAGRLFEMSEHWTRKGQARPAALAAAAARQLSGPGSVLANPLACRLFGRHVDWADEQPSPPARSSPRGILLP